MIILTPAKINLGLRVLEKRSDGFHNLDSYIYAIPLYDILEILPQPTDELIQTGIIASSSMHDNLVYKALLLLRKQYEIPPLKIHLHKQIPVQAGLGGGSGNAVGMLQLLNQEFHLRIGEDQMLTYAAELGSDCPFFVKAHTSRLSSKGERLSAVHLSLTPYFIVIIKPQLSISTAEAFATIKPSAICLPDILSLSEDEYQNQLINDFDVVLSKKYEEIGAIKAWLLAQGAFMASLSGSGSAVFGLFKEKRLLDIPFDAFVWQGSL